MPQRGVYRRSLSSNANGTLPAVEEQESSAARSPTDRLELPASDSWRELRLRAEVLDKAERRISEVHLSFDSNNDVTYYFGFDEDTDGSGEQEREREAGTTVVGAAGSRHHARSMRTDPSTTATPSASAAAGPPETATSPTVQPAWDGGSLAGPSVTPTSAVASPSAPGAFLPNTCALGPLYAPASQAGSGTCPSSGGVPGADPSVMAYFQAAESLLLPTEESNGPRGVTALAPVAPGVPGGDSQGGVAALACAAGVPGVHPLPIPAAPSLRERLEVLRAVLVEQPLAEAKAQEQAQARPGCQPGSAGVTGGASSNSWGVNLPPPRAPTSSRWQGAGNGLPVSGSVRKAQGGTIAQWEDRSLPGTRSRVHADWEDRSLLVGRERLWQQDSSLQGGRAGVGAREDWSLHGDVRMGMGRSSMSREDKISHGDIAARTGRANMSSQDKISHGGVMVGTGRASISLPSEGRSMYGEMSMNGGRASVTLARVGRGQWEDRSFGRSSAGLVRTSSLRLPPSSTAPRRVVGPTKDAGHTKGADGLFTKLNPDAGKGRVEKFATGESERIKRVASLGYPTGAVGSWVQETGAGAGGWSAKELQQSGQQGTGESMLQTGSPIMAATAMALPPKGASVGAQRTKTGAVAAQEDRDPQAAVGVACARIRRVESLGAGQGSVGAWVVDEESLKDIMGPSISPIRESRSLHGGLRLLRSGTLGTLGSQRGEAAALWRRREDGSLGGGAGESRNSREDGSLRGLTGGPRNPREDRSLRGEATRNVVRALWEDRSFQGFARPRKEGGLPLQRADTAFGGMEDTSTGGRGRAGRRGKGGESPQQGRGKVLGKFPSLAGAARWLQRTGSGSGKGKAGAAAGDAPERDGASVTKGATGVTVHSRGSVHSPTQASRHKGRVVPHSESSSERRPLAAQEHTSGRQNSTSNSTPVNSSAGVPFRSSGGGPEGAMHGRRRAQGSWSQGQFPVGTPTAPQGPVPLPMPHDSAQLAGCAVNLPNVDSAPELLDPLPTLTGAAAMQALLPELKKKEPALVHMEGAPGAGGEGNAERAVVEGGLAFPGLHQLPIVDLSVLEFFRQKELQLAEL